MTILTSIFFSIFTRAVGSSENAVKKDRRQYCLYRQPKNAFWRLLFRFWFTSLRPVLRVLSILFARSFYTCWPSASKNSPPCRAEYHFVITLRRLFNICLPAAALVEWRSFRTFDIFSLKLKLNFKLNFRRWIYLQFFQFKCINLSKLRPKSERSELWRGWLVLMLGLGNV